MPSYITATVTGHAARDPETKQVGESQVCEFSVPVNKGRRDNQTTTWVRVSVWGRGAEWAQQDIVKGTLVQATGELSVREYAKRDGGTGFSVDMRADKVLALAGRKDRDAAPAPARGPTPNPGYESGEPGWGPGEDLPF